MTPSQQTIDTFTQTFGTFLFISWNKKNNFFTALINRTFPIHWCCGSLLLVCTVWHAPPLSLAGRLVLLNKLYCASLLSVKSLLVQVPPWRGAYSVSTKIKIVAMYPLAGGQYRINVSILATAHLPLP